MFGKRIIAVVTSIVLAVSLCPGAAFASELQAGSVAGQVAQEESAKSIKNLEQRGANFDLANGESFTVWSYLRGYGNAAHSAKVSGLEVTSADPGYKKATFTLTLRQKKMLSEVQGQKVLKAFKKAYYDQGGASGNKREVVWTYWMRGGLEFWLVDYETGKNLDNPDNAAGVKVEGKASYGKARKYETSDGTWSFTQLGVIKVKATITFPEDYENLCLCVGGDMWPRIERTKNDENFEGKYFKFADDQAYTAKWWQTSRFKKANDNFHFMRIS